MSQLQKKYSFITAGLALGLLLLYSCSGYLGEEANVAPSEPLSATSRSKLAFSDFSPVQLQIAEKMLADPDFAAQVQLRKVYRAQRLARMVAMGKAQLESIIIKYGSDNRKPHQKFRELQLMFHTQEELIQYRTTSSALFTKWTNRLTRQEREVLFKSSGQFFATVAARQRDLQAIALANARTEEYTCYTTPEICACVHECDLDAQNCEAPIENEIDMCESGHRDLPPGETVSFCRDFYGPQLMDCFMTDVRCATGCVGGNWPG